MQETDKNTCQCTKCTTSRPYSEKKNKILLLRICCTFCRTRDERETQENCNRYTGQSIAAIIFSSAYVRLHELKKKKKAILFSIKSNKVQ